MSKRRGSRELESGPLSPLASRDPVDQLDGVQEGNEEEEEEVMKISPRSDSPRGWYQIKWSIALIDDNEELSTVVTMVTFDLSDLQDIPEESECGADPS